jgi:peptidoglycan/LPS O-acetylase OafA/YrhL
VAFKIHVGAERQVSGDPSKPHLQYIDCVRGYAILLVITAHVVYEFPNVPFVLHRIAAAGWYGVQLFFLASSVTLLMSWSYDKSRYGTADIGAFYIRRFFRVAPAYYAAGLFYYLLQPPAHFSLVQAITAALFINAWDPAWLPVDPSVWYVVPGGWSISVEFSFYALFPIFATFVTSLKRAVLFVVFSICIGLIANLTAVALLHGAYPPVWIGNFLFFWFPNQLSVFALGGVLFMLLSSKSGESKWLDFIWRKPTLIALIAGVAYCALALSRPAHYIGGAGYAPSSLVFSVPLMFLILALSSGRGILVNRYAAAMGKVSFSAYLLHFAVLWIFGLLPYGFTHASRFEGVATLTIGWILAVAVTFVVALCSYIMVEEPMIGLGKRLIHARRKLTAGPTLELGQGGT